MDNEPVDLDKRRGLAAQKATDIRRLRAEVEADQAALKARLEKLEVYLSGTRAETWADAVETTRYLLGILAETAEGQDPRRRKIADRLLADFDRLLEQTSAR